MKIIVSKYIGFCSGVKRCIKLTEELLKNKSKEVYALGELLHNNLEMERLKSLGLKIVNNIDDLPQNANVIIRTHGIKKDVFEKIDQTKIKVIDGTCPIVKTNQKIAIEYSNKGYNVIIYGDINHPEIDALVSYINPSVKYIIINSDSEIQNIDFISEEKNILIAQTTKQFSEYENIIRKLKQKSPSLKVFNTICKQTIMREVSAQKIAQKVDTMVIIGGKNSANTKKLETIAKQSAKVKKVIFVTSAKELPYEEITNCNSVGIISGASTPLWVIDEVIKTIKLLNGGYRCKNNHKKK